MWSQKFMHIVNTRSNVQMLLKDSMKVSNFASDQVVPHDIVANVLDCDIVLTEFNLQSHYYFQTNTHRNGIKFFYFPPVIG